MPALLEHVPVCCLTPLYQFAFDAEECVIENDLQVLPLREPIWDLNFDNVLRSHFALCKPDRVVFQRSSLPSSYFSEDRLSVANTQDGADMLAKCIAPVREFLQTLRLFAPGHLHAGETFVLVPVPPRRNWATVASLRASDTAVDYSSLRENTKTFSLTAEEMRALGEFRKAISPILQRLESYPAATFAMFLYATDDGERANFSAAVTALEALLTKNEETEGLTYRLSMRLANLLGHSPEARKARFAEMKKVYGIRSKIVHGSPLPIKSNSSPLDMLPSLRETVRRVLLSVLALFGSGVQPEHLPDRIDECAFDDEMRRQIQAEASKLLFQQQPRNAVVNRH
jgi:hypothetical protein